MHMDENVNVIHNSDRLDIVHIAERCIRDEAKAVTGLIQLLDDNFIKAVDLILACHGKVIVTGVGKSGHVGAKIAATLSSTGTPAFFANPLDIYHGDLGVITSDDLVIAISYSGQTDELLRFVPYLNEHNIPLISITGNPESLLARYSTCNINVSVEGEACPLNLAPTCSTTATLVMGDALACTLIECRNFREQDFARFHPGGSIGRRLLTTARDVMRSDNLPTMTENLPLYEAVIRVSEGKLGLCVSISDGKVNGLITDGDVRRAMQNLKRNFFDMPVGSVMTRSPKCVSPDTKITVIQQMMNEYKIHTLLVVDSEKHLLGVVDHFSCML